MWTFWGIFLTKYICHHRDSCTSLFIAALFTLCRKWDQPRCLPVDEWIMKMHRVTEYTMEIYLTIKINETMNFTGKLIDLENVLRLPRLTKTNIACSFLYVGPSFKYIYACIYTHIPIYHVARKWMR